MPLGAARTAIIRRKASATIFIDDFNRADEALEDSPDWTLVNGSASAADVVNNKVETDDTSSTGSAYASPNLGSADHYTQAEVDDEIFFCVRMTDSNNFIGIRWDVSQTEWQIFKREAGAFTELGDDTVTGFTAGDTMRIEAQGDQITGKVNGATIIGPLTETFNQTETQQGFVARNNIAAFDNYEAGTL